MFYNLSEEDYARVQPSQLQHFLESTGWSNTDEVPGKYFIYHLPSNASAEVIVPAQTYFRDYIRRVSEALHELAQVQSRTILSVFNDIIIGVMDNLVYHIDSPQIREHRIDLESGVNLYQSALQGLRAAAHDQIRPKRYHERMTKKEAMRYIECCELGVATPGSYVANIYCPANFDLLTGQTSVYSDLDASFARNVTSRFMRSLSYAVEAIKHGDTNSLVPLEDTESVISSNFFSAMSELPMKGVQTELEVSVKWTPAIKPPVDVPERVVIQQEYLHSFSDIAQRLRTRRSPETQVIVGRVAVLSGEEGDTSLMQGEVLIDGETSEGEIVRVRVDLPDKDYARACDAHKLNQKVHISGTMRRGNRLHELHQPFGFGVDAVQGSATRSKTA